MTNILNGLLERIEDQSLQIALKKEVDRLRSTKEFGLVFEKHMPENVRLYSHPVRRGLHVKERSGRNDSTWLVRRVRDGKATLVDADGQESERAVEELVVVRQFGEPIYPGLKSVGRIERGGDKRFHTVIKGENYHVLETLLYAYEGKVDCIYIDPHRPDASDTGPKWAGLAEYARTHGGPIRRVMAVIQDSSKQMIGLDLKNPDAAQMLSQSANETDIRRIFDQLGGSYS